MDIKRGFLWCTCFFVLFISNIEILLILLMRHSFFIFLPYFLLWFWRLKFVFIDLKPKHMKVDIGINAVIIVLRFLFFGYFIIFRQTYVVPDEWVWFFHEGLPTWFLGFFFYILFGFGIIDFPLSLVLSFALNPFRMIYLIAEIRVLKRVNFKLQQSH